MKIFKFLAFGLASIQAQMEGSGAGIEPEYEVEQGGCTFDIFSFELKTLNMLVFLEFEFYY